MSDYNISKSKQSCTKLGRVEAALLTDKIVTTADILAIVTKTLLWILQEGRFTGLSNSEYDYYS